ncbi:MAG: CaiB/BaiF CoA transferase family protein [Ilumatobacteraceae bacterium]
MASDRTTSPRPLEGIRVLDFTRVLSGPHCTRMLCDLGADVIKIEPPDGDLTRFAYPRVGSVSTYFTQQNIGKSNISLDLKRPEAVDIVLRLAAVADVLVENYRGGVMDKLGLGWDAVHGVNPRLIYASISGYGNTGPWTHRRAYASVINAETGLTGIQARAHGGHLGNDPHSHGDVYTGMETAAAILAALFQRTATGEGQRIDVSMAQTMLYVNEHAQSELFDGDVSDNVIRSFQPGDYPVLTVGDGRDVLISGHPAEAGTFNMFVDALGRADLLDDPRFIDVASRKKNIDALLDIIRAWARTFPDAEAMERECDRAGLAFGVLRTMPELVATDWADERKVTVTVDDRNGGAFRIPNAPWAFSGSDTSTRGESKYRGEDNARVLTELLGLTGDEVARLTAEGVLSERLPRR